MTLAVYRVTYVGVQNSIELHLSRILLEQVDTMELFNSVRKDKALLEIQASAEKDNHYPAFHISGLSENINVLKAGITLLGEDPIKLHAHMVFIDIGCNEGESNRYDILSKIRLPRNTIFPN